VPRGKLETIRDCEDFVRGCTFFGVGGGGAPSKGLKLLTDELADGRVPAWVDLDELPDDAWLACAWGMGSIAPLTPEREAAMAAVGLERWRVEKNLAAALRELEAYTGRRLTAVVPLEPGGSNTPNPLAAATRLGLATVDADLAGRAIPEITQTLPVLAGKPVTPMAAVDLWGDVSLIRETVNPAMAERIGKFLAVAAFGHTGLAGFLMRVGEAGPVVVRGTLSRCHHLGRVIREAREARTSVVEAILEATGAVRLFTGIVSKKEWEDRDGYMIGKTTIIGSPGGGGVFEIWFKNENHVGWLDGVPVASSPDLISVVHATSGEPVTNTDVQVDQPVVVFGLPCVDAFRSPRGLEALGPGHFGFDIDYSPVEEP